MIIKTGISEYFTGGNPGSRGFGIPYFYLDISDSELSFIDGMV